METLNALGLDDLVARVTERGDLPNHVAIIMDGNGRWAQKRFLPRLAGHRAGRHAVRHCVEACGRIGIQVLTLYTFSQENFNRPAAEVKALWHFLQETLGAERDELDRRNVRLAACGALDQLPDKARQTLTQAIDTLAGNTGLTLNLALAYGGRQEILQAALRLSERLESGELKADQVTEDDFAQGLYSPDLPDPDLVIRTSGEARLSNFLLWQSAYSEILITPVLWPDFGQRDLLLAVADYQNRERRFGALPADRTGDGQGKAGSLLDPARWKRLLKVRP
ncbi:MAG: di-trans,poly-cis-decaprenylcistransferase [Candidatus Krumholzibacteria bacterium]|nr:di-trans,poly-cis-decaprenylcistransferase [Candidatus Krumholzibacteria bacterium]